jgi:hypothetical protein
MAKESPSNTQHTASAAHQRKPLNPEDAIYIPAPMRPSRAVAQVVARAIARNRCRRRGPAAAKIDTHGAASHGERKNLPDHSRLTGLALDHSLTANTVASFVQQQQQQAASDLLDTATSSPDKAFAQRNTREGDARFEHTRKLSERDHPIISVVSRKETHVRVNMEGRGLYNEAKNLSEREACWHNGDLSFNRPARFSAPASTQFCILDFSSLSHAYTVWSPSISAPVADEACRSRPNAFNGRHLS